MGYLLFLFEIEKYSVKCFRREEVRGLFEKMFFSGVRFVGS